MYDEILRSLGRIEGRLIGIEKLSERVAQMDTSLAWLKGGWAALLAAYLYIYKKF